MTRSPLLPLLLLSALASSAHAHTLIPNNPLSQPERATALSVGDGHACLLNNCGEVRCWGDNNYGEINAPKGYFSAVAAGRDHSCALDGNGSVVCWGNIAQPSLSGQAIQIDSGRYHACAVVDTAWDRRLECWGSNGQGRASPPLPTQIPLYLGAHLEVSAGGYHSCSVTDQGFMQCWGYNAQNQSSATHPSYPDSPLATDQGGFFDFPHRWDQVDAGLMHTCALRRTSAADNAQCWGYNGYGQAAAPAGRFDYVGAGDYFSCGLRSSGQVDCWGMSAQGRVAPPVLNRCERQLFVKQPVLWLSL